MNWKLIIASIVVILTIISGSIIYINDYIKTQAALQANEAILKTQIAYQQAEILLQKKLDKEYKSNVKIVEKTVEKRVPLYISTPDSSCETKLNDVNNIVKSYLVEEVNEETSSK